MGQVIAAVVILAVLGVALLLVLGVARDRSGPQPSAADPPRPISSSQGNVIIALLVAVVLLLGLPWVILWAQADRLNKLLATPPSAPSKPVRFLD